MIYTQLDIPCEIVGFVQSDPEETDMSVMLIRLVLEEGVKHEGLTERVYVTDELRADGGRKEIRTAIGSLVR